MKRLLIIVLLLLALAGLLASCSIGAMSDAEAAAIIAENAEKARELEEIVYGKGLALADPSLEEGEGQKKWTAAHYEPIAQDCPYRSIEEIKALGEVFSSERCAEMWTYAFEGTQDFFPRYSVNTDGTLARDLRAEPMGMLTAIFPESAKVKAGNKYSVEVEIEAERIALSGEPERYRKTIRLILEDGKWVFDCAVY